ncbi:MAG: hypothetical protein HZA93_05420 [Verrucomicrobia bacterium]|nr:hypothetical protein [Verrucomicrobiota bacterium]
MKNAHLPVRLPAQLDIPAGLAVALMEAAAKSIRASLQSAVRAHRPRRGETLKPGAATPLWNELAAATRAQLSRRGEKSRLARILGLPRQRLHDMLRARRQLPDAERTLLLLVWLQTRSEGHDLA